MSEGKVEKADFERWSSKVREAFDEIGKKAERASKAFRRCGKVLQAIEAKDRAAMRAVLDARALRRMRHARRALRARLRAGHFSDVVVPASYRVRLVAREAFRLWPRLEVVGRYGPAHAWGFLGFERQGQP